jgi:transposase
MLNQEKLFSENEILRNEVQGLKLQVESHQDKIKHYESEVSRLYEMLLELKRMKFGTKSERWESSEQLVFNEVEIEFKKPEPSAKDDDEIKVGGYTKKRGGRKPLPLDLEREVIIIELPEAERFTEDGMSLKIIGYEISEKLSYEPSKTKVIQYRRAKYGVNNGDYEKTAPPVPSIIPKGIATPELVAAITTQKYSYGLPLYRQEEMFAQMGVDLPRQTMARWVVQSSEACIPVYNILCDRLLEDFYVSCDETPTQVLKEKGRAAESKSWMWVRCTPFGKNKIILFDYDPSRSGEVAKKLFTDFKGFLQVDGYAGYNTLEKNLEIMRIGCNMHGRRYFEQAKTIGAKSGQSLGEMGLRFYKQLYEFEEGWRSLPPEERHRLRQEKHVPVWDEFKAWVELNYKKVPPKSKIGKAFHYFLSEYEYLIGYLKDGRLEMDNGFAERAIRKFAIGRNNWIFADTEAGANASAIFYSLICTAKINGVKPYEVMKYLFIELPKAKTLEDVERLADVIMGISPLP